ncbi:MAG: GumC family protein [Nitrospinota bacterium]
MEIEKKKSQKREGGNNHSPCPFAGNDGVPFPFLPPAPDEKEINLFDLLQVLLRRKLILFVITTLFFVGSVAVSLQLPEIYQSKGTILPPDKQSGSASLLANLGGGLGGMFAGNLLGGGSKSDLWVSILRSRTIAKNVVERLDLVTLYKVKSESEAIEKLGGASAVTMNKKDGIITVSVEDRVPEKAAEIVGTYFDELDKLNKKFIVSSGKRTRVFIEKRLEDSLGDLSDAEEKLKRFQEKNKALKLDTQSQTIMSVLGSLKGQVMAKEIELQTFLSYASPNNPQAQLITTQIKELKEQVKELSQGAGPKAEGIEREIFIPTSKFPELGLEYARLLRDLKVQQTLYEMLRQQFEMAKIQEAKDSSTVQILDFPAVPEKRFKPRRRVIVMLSTLLGFFSALFLVFVLEAVGKYKKKSPAGKTASPNLVHDV